MDIGNVVVRIGADISSFVAGMSNVSTQLNALAGKTSSASKTLGEGMQAAGNKISDAGVAITKTLAPIAGALTGLGVLSLKSAMDFESSFASVKKAVEASGDELKQFEQQFRSLAKEIPLSANEINKLAAEGAQLGVANDALTSFVKTVAQMATTTNLSAVQAGNAFARIANIMGLAQQDFNRMGSAIFDLGRKSAATESEITSMAMRIAGAGKTVGMTTDQVLATAAALASVGVRAEMGGSAISRLMMMMAKSVDGGKMSLQQFADATGFTGDKLQKEFAKAQGNLSEFAKVAGMSADQFAAKFKTAPAEAITAWLNGVQRIQQSGGPVFEVLDSVGVKSVQMRDAVLRAASAGDLMAKSLATGANAWQQNTALAEGAAQRYSTMQSQLTLFNNKLNDLKITLGQAFIPIMQTGLQVMTPMVDMLASAAQWFQSLDPGVQKAVAGFTVFASVLGPALVALGAIVSALAPLAPLFTALTGPIGLVAAGVIGLAAVTAVVISNWTQLKAMGAAVWNDLKVSISTTVQNLVSLIEQWMVTKLNAIWSKVKAPIEEVKQYFRGLYDAVVGHSYIPDMVNETGKHMNRLHAIMTNPARVATRETAMEFFNLQQVTSQTMQEMSSAAIFTWGSIRSSLVNSLVDMTTSTANFKKFIQAAEKTILASVFNVTIEMGVQWALRSLMAKKQAADQVATTTAVEEAKTAIMGTNEAARFMIAEATNKAIMGSVIATLGGIAAVGNASLGIMGAVVDAMAEVLAAIAAALDATIVGAEMSGPFWEAAVTVAMAGSAAVETGGGAIQEAIGSAIGVASKALTPMATGGIVTGPTPALVGEAGPEAIIPLNRLAGMMGSSEHTIIVELDGRTIAKNTLLNMPRLVRVKGLSR